MRCQRERERERERDRLERYKLEKQQTEKVFEMKQLEEVVERRKPKEVVERQQPSDKNSCNLVSFGNNSEVIALFIDT